MWLRLNLALPFMFRFNFYLWQSLQPTSWSVPCPSVRSQHWTGSRTATRRWRTLHVGKSQRTHGQWRSMSHREKTQQLGSLQAALLSEWPKLRLMMIKYCEMSIDWVLSGKTLHGGQTDRNYSCHINTDPLFICNNPTQSCKHTVAPRKRSN